MEPVGFHAKKSPVGPLPTRQVKTLAQEFLVSRNL